MPKINCKTSEINTTPDTLLEFLENYNLGQVLKEVKKAPVHLSVLVAQFPITLNIRENLDAITSVLAHAEQDDLVILPEGALSGYAEDPTFLQGIDKVLLTESQSALRDQAARHRVHLVFGSCVYEASQWYNGGLYYGPNRETFLYRKVNLATGERGARPRCCRKLPTATRGASGKPGARWIRRRGPCGARQILERDNPAVLTPDVDARIRAEFEDLVAGDA